MREWGRYPLWVPPPPERSEPSRADLNRAASPRTATVAAEGSVIPVVYGRASIAPMVFAVVSSGGALYLGLAWAMGEIQGVEAIYLNDESIDASKVVAHYAGTVDQGVDPTLASLITGYNDNLVGTYANEDFGVAYSVIRLSSDDPFPGSIQGIIQGRKVRDPRGSFGYSTNPSLCLADFIESRALGLGKAVDDAKLAAAADFADSLMSDSRPRLTINLAITRRTSIDSHIEALRAYAQVYLYEEKGVVHLVPMAPRAVDGAISDDDLIEGGIRIEQTGAADQPTVQTIVYSDRRQTPWSDRPYSVQALGVSSGAVPWRESEIQMPGIDNQAEAHRLAVRRLNHATLVNLRVRWDGFDELMQYAIGDVLEVTHQFGLTAKPMRVIGSAAVAVGRWRLELEEYREDVYSEEVQADPGLPDTGLLPPQNVPSVEDLVAVEVIYQTDKGFSGSRFAISWAEPANYVYPITYRVQVTAQPAAGVTPGIISEILTRGLSANSGPLQELAVYDVRIRAESQWGAELYVGPWSVVTKTAQGKFLPPSDVPELRGIEAGGEVFLDWDAAIDLDIWRYELRYGAQGVAWEAAQFLDRVDALKLRSRDVPRGTWEILIKAIDSVRKESANPARKVIEVTFDPSQSNKARHDYLDGSAVNMTRTVDGDGRDCWVSDGGTTWDAALPNLLETYTEKLVSYTVVASSSWTSDIYDWGDPIDGDWSMPDFSASQADGQTPLRRMDLEDAGDAWQQFPTLSAKGAFKRSRAHAEPTAPGEVLIVCIPTVRLEISASPKTERGEGLSSSTGPTTVTLTNSLHVISSIQITPQGNAPLTGVYDNVQLGDPTTFDVYIFDANNQQVSVFFSWACDGI